MKSDSIGIFNLPVRPDKLTQQFSAKGFLNGVNA